MESKTEFADKAHLHKLSSVAVLFKSAVSVYKSRSESIIAVALVPVVVSVVGYLASLSGILWPIVIILALVSFIISLLFYPAIFFTIISDSSGDLISLASGFYKRAAAVFWPYVGVLGLVILAILGGGLLFIIPAIFVSVQLSFSIFSILNDGKRGREALLSSWQYVRGRWWAVFWRYIALFITVAIAQGIINSILRSIFPAAPPQFPEGVPIAPHWFQTLSSFSPSPLASLVSGVIGNLFFTPFTIIYSFLMYKDLKASVPQDTQVSGSGVNAFIVLGIIALALIIIAALASSIFALVNLQSLYQ